MKNALVNDLELFSPKSFFNDDWFNFGKYPIFFIEKKENI